LRQLALWVAVLAAGGIGVGYLVEGAGGLVAGAIGAGVTFFFCGTTAAVMAVTMRRPVSTQSAWLVVSWVVKTIALLGVFIVVDRYDWIDRPVLAVTVLVGVIGSLILDSRLVLRARISPGD
jgi:hypothetical protein